MKSLLALIISSFVTLPVEVAFTAFSASAIKSPYGVLSLLFTYSARLSALKIAFCTRLLPYLSKNVPFSQ